MSPCLAKLSPSHGSTKPFNTQLCGVPLLMSGRCACQSENSTHRCAVRPCLPARNPVMFFCLWDRRSEAALVLLLALTAPEEGRCGWTRDGHRTGGRGENSSSSRSGVCHRSSALSRSVTRWGSCWAHSLAVTSVPSGSPGPVAEGMHCGTLDKWDRRWMVWQNLKARVRISSQNSSWNFQTLTLICSFLNSKISVFFCPGSKILEYFFFGCKVYSPAWTCTMGAVGPAVTPVGDLLC